MDRMPAFYLFHTHMFLFLFLPEFQFFLCAQRSEESHKGNTQPFTAEIKKKGLASREKRKKKKVGQELNGCDRVVPAGACALESRFPCRLRLVQHHRRLPGWLVYGPLFIFSYFFIEMKKVRFSTTVHSLHFSLFSLFYGMPMYTTFHILV